MPSGLLTHTRTSLGYPRDAIPFSGAWQFLHLLPTDKIPPAATRLHKYVDESLAAAHTDQVTELG